MDFIEELQKLDKNYNDLENLEQSPVHKDLTYRMKKTLYAGDKTETDDADGIPVPLNDIVVELFQAQDSPRITLAQRHVGNITKRAHVTQCSTFLGMLYARRLKQRNPEFMTRVTSTELFLVSMMLATKFLYDEGEDEEFFNDEWAHVGKMDVKRVHELERVFLDALDWNLFVDPMEFFELLQAVETRIALNQGSKRGWFSYTDLYVLMNTPEWYQVCMEVIESSLKIVCVCTMVYTLCAASMVWSGVMLHHAQVPHRPCHGRLPMPFVLHHTKATHPWQPVNPVLDQLLFTFLFRLPVNSDPLGLTLDHSLTWCSSSSTTPDDTDGTGHAESSSAESISDSTEATQTKCPHDWNLSSSQIERDGLDDEMDKPQTNDLKQSSARVNNIQEALVLFYHALLSALWEVKEISKDTEQPDLATINTNETESCLRSNDTPTAPVRKQKRSCPHRRNQLLKSSQRKMNVTLTTLVNRTDVESLPNLVIKSSADNADASDTRVWDSHGTPEGSHEKHK